MTAPVSEVRLRRRLEKARRSCNYLTLVVRGHHIIEEILRQGIRKYAHADSKELYRLPFSLKTELAIALGLLIKDSLPLFKVLNKIRNHLAHDPFAEFTDKYATDLANSLSQKQQNLVLRCAEQTQLTDVKKRDLLWWCIVTCYAQIHASIRSRIRAHVAHDVTMQDVGPLVEEIRAAGHSKHVEEEFAAQVEEISRRIPTF